MQREISRLKGTSHNPVLVSAVRVGNLVFAAGMSGRDPATGALAGDDSQSQGRQTMRPLRVALEEAGTSLDQALKIAAFVADLAGRSAFNEVNQEFFQNDPPPGPVSRVVR
jgi:2-iminobutanoate/2-iminopropanoate deaminase